MYYFFTIIAFFYKGKKETFINNIVEFTRNQSRYDFKVIGFFNSESNANIIKLYLLIKNIITLINTDQKKN